MAKDEDALNLCGHRNSERVKALKKFPSGVCPTCLSERIKELLKEEYNRGVKDGLAQVVKL